MSRVIEEITPLIESRLKELGYELYDIRFFNAGSHTMLRISIDTPKGVSINDCETASNEISIVLEQANFLNERKYNLEVSSPGIDRPLKTERDYNRLTGRFVIVHLSEAIDGKKTLQGEVVSCESNKLTLKIEDIIVEIPLSYIYSGKEEIRFK